MKFLPLASAIMFSAPLLPVSPAVAQNTQTEVQRCRSALSTAENLLIRGRNLWITNVSVHGLAETYMNYPYQTPAGLSIIMAGDSAPNIMSSPQLLTSVTETIMSGCPNVGLVGFWVDRTDWVREFGLIGSEIREFECIPPDDTNNPIQWGYGVCL